MENPQEEYTQRLIAAAPVPDPVEQGRRRRERHELLREQGEEIVELKVDGERFHQSSAVAAAVEVEELDRGDDRRR